MATNYVYIRSEPTLYTVGFYDPQGKWHPDSDYNDREEAAKRVAWLNGSKSDPQQPVLKSFELDAGDNGERIKL